MPMRFAPVPPEAAAALDMHANAKTGPLRVHAATVALDVSAPHPVYTAGANDIVAGRVLANARLTAWRAMVAGIAAAEVSPQGELSYVNEGRFVEGTLAAIDAARDLDGELRLLRIPAVQTIVLWLHDEANDILIPIAPAPPPLVPNEPIGEAAFTAALRPLAEQVIAGPQIT